MDPLTVAAAPVVTTRERVAVQHTIIREKAFYRPELDVLRFFAFLAVFVVHTASYPLPYLLAHHLPLWAAELEIAVAGAGAYGVDVFFVLSAYLITELLLREKEEKGALDVKAFYLRRILRIWPLYYLFIPLVAMAPILNPNHAFSLHYAVPFLLLVGNWSFVLYGWPASIAVPLWSISVEEQFYLLWPPVVARLSRRQIVQASLGMIVLANTVRIWVFLRHGTSLQLWGNTFAHLDTIAAGILLAIFLKGEAPRMSSTLRLALIAAAAGCLCLRGHFVTMLEGDTLSWSSTVFGYPMVAAACAVIVLAFIGLPFRPRALCYLGKISYGLYVYHMMCITFTDRILGAGHGFRYLAIRAAMALGLTVFIASVSYAAIEKPFLKLKRRFTYVQSRPD